MAGFGDILARETTGPCTAGLCTLRLVAAGPRAFGPVASDSTAASPRATVALLNDAMARAVTASEPKREPTAAGQAELAPQSALAP